MLQATHPDGSVMDYGYDTMGRPKTLRRTAADQTITDVVTVTTYGVAGELLTIAGAYAETRTYNTRLQMTSLNGSTIAYPAGTLNDGQILSETISGETVTYQYDALKRLVQASTDLGPGIYI